MTDACHMEALFHWFASGADPAKYPSFQNDENKHSDLLVVTPQGEIHKYEHAAFPIRFEDRLFAMGSGRDYALAAMHLGKSASEAVEVAAAFDTGCGNGVDALTLKDC